VVGPALLVMDVVPLVAPVFARDPRLPARLAAAADAARRAGVPVLFGRIAFRAGYPEVAPTNQLFIALQEGGLDLQESNPETDFHPAVAPQSVDHVFTKRRVSSFIGSDLEVLLRGLQVDHLVLTGVATSGVVLSTLRAAADLDFRVTVLSDGCADADPEVHDVLMGKVFPKQASVVTVADWTATL
jgi:nicotinamidase-related amidase